MANWRMRLLNTSALFEERLFIPRGRRMRQKIAEQGTPQGLKACSLTIPSRLAEKALQFQ
jgi:hypothetical protein